MDQYLKTDLGIQALKQRSFQLNARQRQLLLLIGTDDFEILNSGLKKRLATPELIQQLEDLGLIFQNQTHSPLSNTTKINTRSDLDHSFTINDGSEIVNGLKKDNHLKIGKDLKTNNHIEITEKQGSAELATSTITVSTKLTENQQQLVIETKPIQLREDAQPELTCISFDEIKQKMMDLLHNHCGLMARQLILRIQQATSIRDIKLCQMQWITALQESRISPLELNHTMQQINHSMQYLQSA